jgi:hypothetical protein
MKLAYQGRRAKMEGRCEAGSERAVGEGQLIINAG